MSDKYAWRVPQLSADLATYSANATKPSFQPLNGKGLSLRNLLYKSAEVSLVELAEIAPALKKYKNFTIERLHDWTILCTRDASGWYPAVPRNNQGNSLRDTICQGFSWSTMGHSRYFYIPYERPPYHDLNLFMTRPPKNVDVLAVPFQIPCFRPETPALYTRSSLTNHESREQKRTSANTLGTGGGLYRSRTARTSAYWGALIMTQL